MKDTLQSLVDKFNATEDEKLKKKIEELERDITIIFEDNGSYHFSLKNGKLSDVEEGYAKGDIEITTTTDVFKKIINDEMDALSAYITKKIKVKASLMDKILISELLK